MRSGFVEARPILRENKRMQAWSRELLSPIRRNFLRSAAGAALAAVFHAGWADVPPVWPNCDPGPCPRPPHPTPSPPAPAPPVNLEAVGARRIAITTVDGHFLTAADGGGYGGPDNGPGAVALHSDAGRADVWEKFEWIWLDEKHGKFALRTMAGTFLTAVNGGGIGGPNDGRSPFHTDATHLGADEVFQVESDGAGKISLRTRKGFYMTAVNGGRVGGPNTTPLHTDAKSIGPWETFTAVSLSPRKNQH